MPGDRGAAGRAPRRERERLRPLAIAPAEYALRFSVFVGPTGWVPFPGRRSSMPPEAIGIPGMRWLYPERGRIVAGRDERAPPRVPPRVPEPGSDRIPPEDRARRLAPGAGQRGRLSLQRPEILDRGPAAEAFLTEIVHRQRFTGPSAVEPWPGALGPHGPAARHRALARAPPRERSGAPPVLRRLEREEA